MKIPRSPKREVKPEALVRETAPEHGASRRVSATEAARRFSDLLNRVRYRGETFIIERGGEPVGELRPASPRRMTGADLAFLLRSLPPVDDGFAEAVEEGIRNQPSLPESPWER